MKKSRDKKNIKYKVGDILEVKTFAGPSVYKKVLRKINSRTKWTSLADSRKKELVEVNGFEGCFTRRKDLYSLKKCSVPYSGKEKLSKTESFTFDWQIIRVIKKV
tara:strand:+ start:157 stop:471 length:315 start_codon:yes stop_codon:yes gene_type:complete